MQYVSIDDMEPCPYDEQLHTDRRELTGPLNTAHVAITRYVLEPGERFSGAVHAHVDQEEVFVVVAGEATFETRAPCSGVDGANVEPTSEGDEITVGEHEAIRFAPGEFQSGKNDSNDVVVAFALGAPRDTEDVRITRIPVLGDRNVECPDCGHDNLRLPDEEDASLLCPDCGAESEV